MGVGFPQMVRWIDDDEASAPGQVVELTPADVLEAHDAFSHVDQARRAHRAVFADALQKARNKAFATPSAQLAVVAQVRHLDLAADRLLSIAQLMRQPAGDLLELYGLGSLPADLHAAAAALINHAGTLAHDIMAFAKWAEGVAPGLPASLADGRGRFIEIARWFRGGLQSEIGPVLKAAMPTKTAEATRFVVAAQSLLNLTSGARMVMSRERSWVSRELGPIEPAIRPGAPPPSPDALRMKRMRERKKQGIGNRVFVDLHDFDLSTLQRLGFVSDSPSQDELEQALGTFLRVAAMTLENEISETVAISVPSVTVDISS